jgi:hypothetical protein
VNKFGQSNKTSWDSFSYGIMMGHNVWHHINAVQEANRQYDNNVVPNMLYPKGYKLESFRDIVDAIFATSDKGKALDLIKEYEYFWNQVIGTRGASGKRATSAIPMFNKFFTELNVEVKEEFDEEDTSKLEELEKEVA